MFAQWAGFVYDDLAHIASNRLVKEGYFSGSEHFPLPCCREGLQHSECFPIRYTLNGVGQLFPFVP